MALQDTSRIDRPTPARKLWKQLLVLSLSPWPTFRSRNPWGRRFRRRSSLDLAKLASGSMDSGEDLLSHGALLDLSASPTVAAPVPEARPDTALIPTLTASTAGELLDPEVLLGVSEAGGPARMDGTNGTGTLPRGDTKAPAATVSVAKATGETAPAALASAPMSPAAAATARKIAAAAKAAASRRAGATLAGVSKPVGIPHQQCRHSDTTARQRQLFRRRRRLLEAAHRQDSASSPDEGVPTAPAPKTSAPLATAPHC